MPDSAGEWERKPVQPQSCPAYEVERQIDGSVVYFLRSESGVTSQVVIAIDPASRFATKRVIVTETPGAGRLCRELRMGGSAIVGFDPWSGLWKKVEKRTIVRRKKTKGMRFTNYVQSFKV